MCDESVAIESHYVPTSLSDLPTLSTVPMGWAALLAATHTIICADSVIQLTCWPSLERQALASSAKPLPAPSLCAEARYAQVTTPPALPRIVVLKTRFCQ